MEETKNNKQGNKPTDPPTTDPDSTGLLATKFTIFMSGKMQEANNHRAETVKEKINVISRECNSLLDKKMKEAKAKADGYYHALIVAATTAVEKEREDRICKEEDAADAERDAFLEKARKEFLKKWEAEGNE